eukprot:g26185.t1
MIAGYEFGHRLPEEDRKLFQFARTEQFEPLGSEIVSEFLARTVPEVLEKEVAFRSNKSELLRKDTRGVPSERLYGPDASGGFMWVAAAGRVNPEAHVEQWDPTDARLGARALCGSAQSGTVLFSDGMRRTDRRLRDLEEISSARLCVDGMAPEHGFVVKSLCLDFAPLPDEKTQRLPNLLEWVEPRSSQKVLVWIQDLVNARYAGEVLLPCFSRWLLVGKHACQLLR